MSVIRDSIFILFSFFACNAALKSSDLCFESDNRFYIIYIRRAADLERVVWIVEGGGTGSVRSDLLAFITGVSRIVQVLLAAFQLWRTLTGCRGNSWRRRGLVWQVLGVVVGDQTVDCVLERVVQLNCAQSSSS